MSTDQHKGANIYTNGKYVGTGRGMVSKKTEGN